MKLFGKVLCVIFGIFIIVAGLICLFNPTATYLGMVGYMVGLSMLFDAIGKFIAWHEEKQEGTADGWMLTGAILSLVLAFFVLNDIVLQLGIDAFIAYYVAVWLFFHGIFVICRAWKIRRLHKNWGTKKIGTHWYLPLCIGILMCAFGILCMFKPLIVTTTLGVFLGLGVIVSGANLITIATTPVED